jgi:DNA ligase-associated metallophosphoesterase
MFNNATAFNLEHQRLWLLPQRAAYWQKEKTLLIADLHIGKSAHFRKNGIAVPNQVAESNLNKLDSLLELTKPEHLIILGDLFHSDINQEWQKFTTWRKKYRELEVSLVMGNHDILNRQNYHSGVINIFQKLRLNPFLLVHDATSFEKCDESTSYMLSGHIHPAVQLKGRARQAMKLPCFYFGNHYGILPAFGGFTGTHVIDPEEEDDVFMIADSNIISASKLNS